MKQWYQIVTDENGKMYLQTEDYSLASELSDWDYLCEVYTEKNGTKYYLFEISNPDDEQIEVMNKIIKWRLKGAKEHSILCEMREKGMDVIAIEDLTSLLLK